MFENIHHFNHVFKDGTVVALTIDLTGDEPKAKSNIALGGREDLIDEFCIWTESVAEKILPLLNPIQMRHFAIMGFQNLEGFP